MICFAMSWSVDSKITLKVQRCSRGSAQGGDQAPLAEISRVSAAKSETWSLVLCPRI